LTDGLLDDQHPGVGDAYKLANAVAFSAGLFYVA
jgi:hypothetical protein